jgi:hypothetical protein
VATASSYPTLRNKKSPSLRQRIFFGVAGVGDAHDRKIDPLIEELLCVPVLEDLRL